MEITTTLASGCWSLRVRAASTAFRSSGLVMAAMLERSMVPSALTATLPEVSGTLLDADNEFHTLLLLT